MPFSFQFFIRLAAVLAEEVGGLPLHGFDFGVRPRFYFGIIYAVFYENHSSCSNQHLRQLIVRRPPCDLFQQQKLANSITEVATVMVFIWVP